ncbi:flagellar FliJ family protein, partial [Nocardioides zeicaulis]
WHRGRRRDPAGVTGVDAAEQRLDDATARLAAASDPVGVDPATFATARVAAAGTASEVIALRAAVATAVTFTTSAREHWQRDRTRLAAVELLLERRGERRREERARRERVEVDDLVAARWLRARAEAGAV